MSEYIDLYKNKIGFYIAIIKIQFANDLLNYIFGILIKKNLI